MRRKKSCIAAFALAAAMTVTCVPLTNGVRAYAKDTGVKPAGWVTPYDAYGDIQIGDATGIIKDKTIRTIVDKNGNPVQLTGMSTFGLQWGDGNWVINDAAFDALAYDWKCDIVRLAMYVSEDGYHDHPEELLAQVEKGIQLATERGMYVLVDWHILNGDTKNPSSEYCLEAGENLPEYAEIKKAHPDYRGPQLFFAYLSEKYGDQGNVLFETANEPNGNGTEDGAGEAWKSKLLPYHQSVTDAIRENDADDVDNIIICGTDNWSQFVDAPLAQPVDDDNVMYTMHFYAGTHDTEPDEETGEYWLGQKVINALEGGIPVFCTEWGTSEASGDGGPYINYSERWLDFLEEYNVSWCSWSLALKNEISAAMVGTASKEPTDTDGDGIPNWDADTELSITGNYVRAKIRGEEAPQYGAEETMVDFEDGNATAIVLGDSPVAAEDYPLEAAELADGNQVLDLPASAGGIWEGPRISFQDLGTMYSIYKDLTFDVYLKKDTELVGGKLEIQPIIQTEALGWWGEVPLITLNEDDFVLDEATGLKKAKATVNYEKIKVGGDKLGHITLLIGANNGIYLDNIGLQTWYNGDVADAPVVPDEPGSFIGLPFTFEDGQREGWKPEGDSVIDYKTIAVEEIGDGNHAMSFPVKLEPGKNEWEDGVRLSSSQNIFKYADCLNYDALAMNVYLEKDKATDGKIEISVNSIPNGDGYWYTSGTAVLDPVNGGEAVTTPGGRELLKYYVYVPVNNDADAYGVYPFSEGTPIRNIILALHNADSDYEGRVYYDNIRYVDGDNLDDIDTAVNEKFHKSYLGSTDPVVDEKNGLYEEDGVLRYYKDGEISNDATLVKYQGEYWYVKDGTVCKDETLVKYNSKYWYVKDGKLCKDAALVKYNNQYWYVKDGTLCNDATLVKFNNQYWYVKDARLCKDETLVKYNNKYWYVKEARLCKEAALVKFNNQYWYVKGGTLCNDATLVKFNNQYWYVKDARLCKDETLVKYNNYYWYVKGGKLQATYNGTFKFNGANWKIVNGKVTARA